MFKGMNIRVQQHHRLSDCIDVDINEPEEQQTANLVLTMSQAIALRDMLSAVIKGNVPDVSMNVKGD